MIKYVIFDLDGTLVDTSEGIIESVQYTASVMGWKPISTNKLRSFIGPPLTWSFIRQYRCNEADAKLATKIFRQYYQQDALLKAKVYDEVYSVCEELRTKGIKMSVATNKPDRFAKKILEFFQLTRYCKPIYGADDYGNLKKSDLIMSCLKDMVASLEETVLIGDTTNDAKGAEEAGVHFLAVTYGFGFKKKHDVMPYPTIGVAGSPSQILQIITKESEDRLHE